MEVMRRMSDLSFNAEIETIITKEDVFKIREEVNGVKVSESIEKYIIELVYATRNPQDYGLDDLQHYIQFGASPRASINMNLAAKVMAFFNGRDFVLPEDIKEIAPDILNHRIILNYEAEADGITMNKDFVLYDAIEDAKRLAKDYKPPVECRLLLPGRDVLATIEIGIENAHKHIVGYSAFHFGSPNYGN